MSDEPGCWVAFNWDGSAFVPFAEEVEALRYALSLHMSVSFVHFGDEDWMRHAAKAAEQ